MNQTARLNAKSTSQDNYTMSYFARFTRADVGPEDQQEIPPWQWNGIKARMRDLACVCLPAEDPARH